MLYADGISNNEFAGILKALQDIGMEETTLKTAEEYLDMTGPMNNALLDGITAQDITGRIGRQEQIAIQKAVEREINSVQNEELRDRYTLLAHAIAGSTCSQLLGFANGTDHDAQRLRALKMRFGAQASAIDLAIAMERYAQAAWASMRQCTDPSTIYEAIEFCTAKLPRAKLMLCTYFLCLVPLPEKKMGIAAVFSGNKIDPRVETTVLRLENTWKDMNVIAQDPRCMLYFLLATAAAASLSETLAERLEANLTPKLKEVYERAYHLPVPVSRIFDAITETSAANNPEYICWVGRMTQTGDANFKDGAYLKKLAIRFPAAYQTALVRSSEEPLLAILMTDILREAAPHALPQYDTGHSQHDTKQLCMTRCIDAICKDYPDAKDAIVSYLCSEAGLETLLPLAPQLALAKYTYNRKRINYIAAYGVDDFAKRCICVQALATNGLSYYHNSTPGFEIKNNEKLLVDILRECGMPFPCIFKCASETIESAPDYNGIQVEMRDKFFLTFSEDPAEVAACDVKMMNVIGRSLYLEILSREPETYKSRILALADDSSKVIRAELAAYLKQRPEWTEDVLTLLKAKKAAKRELAAQVLGAFDITPYRAEIQAAFEAEKKADIKQKLAAMLGEECPAEAAAESTADLIKDLTKGNKAKKLQWLFDTPFAPVRKVDGTPAETAHLQAILLCYANMTICGVSDMANGLAALLHQDDLAAFALEVLGKWLEQGAAAKQKWVLYAAALHGGFEAQITLLHYIKDWSEHSRGAIAAEAVRAIAFKGTSEALMAVDQMARKFKNRQVRAAAANALDQAAEELGITTEELADRIVPNLGFDENLCREFDYGMRKFRVYLTPALELEIYEDEKKLKNLPKPGAKDEPEKAEASAKAFKEMKKQLKAVITAQKQRLEYVLLCQRTWTAQGWQELFVKNPVMHCFAMGLIWGTYDEDGRLLETFRYMEDGTFNTPDEDEFELPAQAVIGLVHPVELAEETLSAWKEQLEDYEITQPFPQMDRPVYRIAENEIGRTEVLRFADRSLTNLTLLGRMTKFGWDKGSPQDAGFFYEFTRSDVMRREKDGDGKLISIGNYAELVFSGMCVAYYETEDVTIEKVRFYSLDDSREPVKLETVNVRYFSEIMLQLNAALAAAAQTEE